MQFFASLVGSDVNPYCIRRTWEGAPLWLHYLSSPLVLSLPLFLCPPLQSACRTMLDFQAAQRRHMGEGLSLEMLCAVINNNVRCYDESIEFMEQLGRTMAPTLKGTGDRGRRPCCVCVSVCDSGNVQRSLIALASSWAHCSPHAACFRDGLGSWQPGLVRGHAVQAALEHAVCAVCTQGSWTLRMPAGGSWS